MAIAMPTLGKLSLKPRSNGVSRSTAEKMWMAGGALAAVVILAFGYLIFISGQQSSTKDVRSKIDAAKVQNTALEARLTTLRAQSKNIASYKAIVAKAQLALPSTADASNFLRTLQSIGNTTSTVVSAVTVGVPTAQQGAAAAAPAAPAAGATSPAATGATPAVSSVYTMQITAQVSGSDGNLDRFLQQLQSVQPRAVLLTSITQSAETTGSTSSNGTTLALTMQAFVAPTNLTVPAATPTAAASSSATGS